MMSTRLPSESRHEHCTRAPPSTSWPAAPRRQSTLGSAASSRRSARPDDAAHRAGPKDWYAPVDACRCVRARRSQMGGVHPRRRRLQLGAQLARHPSRSLVAWRSDLRLYGGRGAERGRGRHASSRHRTSSRSTGSGVRVAADAATFHERIGRRVRSRRRNTPRLRAALTFVEDARSPASPREFDGGVALSFGVRLHHAVAQVSVDESQGDAFRGAGHRADLGDDVDAVCVIIDHATSSPTIQTRSK